MSIQLVDKDIKYLTDHFRLLVEEVDEETLSFEQLLDERFLKSFLQEIKQEIGTDELFVAASQFVKRLGFIMTVPAFYAMSRYNKKLPVCLSNMWLISRKKNNKWMPHLFLKEGIVEGLNKTDRQTEFQEFAKALFSNIAKIIEQVSKVSKVPKPILWENVAIYVYWLYEVRLKKDASQALLNQIQADFQSLLYTLPCTAFHETYNPLQKFFSEKKEKAGSCEQIRVRRTCCFYYKTEADGKYCTTCPKSKHTIGG